MEHKNEKQDELRRESSWVLIPGNRAKRKHNRICRPEVSAKPAG